MVLAADVHDDAGGKGLFLLRAVTGDVECVGGFGVGVGVEESVELGEVSGRVWRACQDVGGIGTTRLWVCPPRRRTCRWMRSVLCGVTSSTRRRTKRLRSRCWVFGLDRSAGKSVAKQRIRSFSSPVRAAVASALARS